MSEKKPVVIVGWPTIARLAHGQDVELEQVILIPDDLLHNTAKACREPIGILACSSEQMHPYECGGAPCKHCEKRKTDTHDPEKCALCLDA